ncbi:putative sulfate exporter family transporter [Nitrogeniibacter mangrovi]|uniref:Putative sulfate exporter family transporter n=1 Tax=Nitrogeniibacter mangrovi TaxID=2016596 RepID=A0A6C1B6P3_9RHOO|nr:putative sulfate exporter family transporter [Nitrogeniibacter mangrovi]QID18465.1 putative sulfate exporter family transporter [Nitrogeniibacter mangrovi]
MKLTLHAAPVATHARHLPGLALVVALALVATWLARAGHLARYGASALTLAIVLGALVGNLLRQHHLTSLAAGMSVAQRGFLRAGVALYGLNLSVQQVVRVGGAGLTVDLFMVASTLALGYLVGTRVLRMDRHLVWLTCAGSAICGAAAVVAAVPVLRSDSDKTAAAVATVVIFGTLSMLVDPLLYHALPATHPIFGVFVGATVHEVAQVVAIGKGLGGEVAGTAVIVKMIRVMLLVPFLLTLSWLEGRGTDGERRITVPWFALAFLALAGVNSLQVVPEPVLAGLRQLGIWLLTAAMAGLGLSTTLAAMRRAGLAPLRLAALLFIYLVLAGGAINWWLLG